MTTSKYLDWNGVMNALAGTTGLEAQLAANVLAGWNYQKNGVLDLLGALAIVAGDPINSRSLNALCNQIAGLAPGTLDALGALNLLLANGGIQTDAMVKIAQFTAAGGESSHNFTSIPATYSELMLVWSIISTAGTNGTLNIRFNNDSTLGHYQYDFVWDNAGVAGAVQRTNEASLFSNQWGGFGNVTPSNGRLWIPNYASTSITKTGHWYHDDFSTAAARTASGMVEWNQTAAINEIDCILNTQTLAAGSVITLYGTT